MGTRRVRGGTLTAIVTMASLVVAACGIDADADAFTRSRVDVQIDMPTASTSTTAPAPITTADLFDVADDVQAWWTKEMPKLYDGRAYEPLPSERIIAGTPDSEYPTCDRRQIRYDDVKENAFAAPCSEGITVVWDAADLMPMLNDTHGPVAAAIVLAHEWGHVAQFEAKVSGAPVLFEQQADCYAGAWLNHVIDSPGPLASVVASTPLDSAVSSIIAFRDEPGSDLSIQGAHGSGFDRVRALQEGFTEGAAFCAGYPDRKLPLIDLGPIQASDDDPDATGNLPIDELVPFVVNDLNAFYNRIIDGFRGASVESVLQDPNASALLQRLSDKIGDNAAGLVLGMIWAGFAQQQVGDQNMAADEKLRQQACLSGGWLADIVKNPDERDFGLTSGDFDEAILGLIDLGTNQGGQSADGGVFDLISALRGGVVDGFDSCQLRA